MPQTFDRRQVEAPLSQPHPTLPKPKVLRAVARPPSFYCEPFAGTLDDWGKVLADFPDREVFQTPEWIRFIAESQGAQPVVLTIKDGAAEVGYFAGLIVPKAGLKILGSPFVGWTTPRMGIRLLPNVSKRAAVQAVTEYAFQQLKCIHFEMNDLNIPFDDLADLGFRRKVRHSYLIDLTKDEQALYSRMSSSACRYRIRKADKLGVIVEEASDEGFVDEYYEQLCDVFAKQSLVPTYDKERVRLLIRHLLPTGNLLLLRRANLKAGASLPASSWDCTISPIFGETPVGEGTSTFAPMRPFNGTPYDIGSGEDRAITIWTPGCISGSMAATPWRTITCGDPSTVGSVGRAMRPG